MEKRKGTALGDLLSSILVILALAILAFSFLDTMDVIARKENAKGVARKYILEMETKGYLPPESMARLLQELEDTGMKDIDLTGTTCMEAGYGNEIHLYIRGRLPMRELTGGSSLASLVFRGTWQDILIHKMSTAKH